MDFLDLNYFKVYINPFDATGNYTSYIDVTKYIEKIGDLSIDVDSQDYQIGLYRYSNFSLSLNNRQGLFSDIDVVQSIFRHNRNDSLVKITYSIVREEPELGAMELGNAIMGEEVTCFIGLLNDESFKFDFKSELVDFKVLGLESLFDRTIVPSALINIGDSVKTTIYNCLNQTTITDLLTVSLANILPDVDQTLDDIDFFTNITVQESLAKLLLVSNSVMYIDISTQTIYVKSRDATVASKYTFYGQASAVGPENILEINQYNNGLHRVFNYFSWKDYATFVFDTDSTLLNKIRKQEIDFGVFTNSGKQQVLLSGLLAEFKDRKIEMQIATPMNYSTLALNLLDRVNIDYPTVYFQGDFALPICGIAVCGDPVTATLPYAQWALYIPITKSFKILKKDFNIKTLQLTFKLREI